MGLLSKGTPLEWAASRQHHDYVKAHGIQQFIHVYRAQKDRADDQFLWGDEVEHLLLHVDPASKRVQLSLRAAEIIDALEPAEPSGGEGGLHQANVSPSLPKSANFLPEYGRFMIEATPSRPYGGFTADLRMVEQNMRVRRAQIQSVLQPSERLITLTAFPLMGVGDFAYCAAGPVAPVAGGVADSEYITDTIIGEHPRFATLTRNIRTRRGARVDIRVPLFQDEHTAKDVAAENAREQAQLEEILKARPASLPPHMPRPSSVDPLREIHMDAMGFGMGCACLQTTFQTRSLAEARHLYDHLAVFSPIMLALTAASPFFRGRVADIDARWTVISQAVDDRTEVERGVANNADGTPAVKLDACGTTLSPAAAAAVAASSSAAASASSASSASAPASSSSPSPSPSSSPRLPQRLYKSRYDSISTYLSLESDFHPKYNDLACEIDPASYQTLLAEGIDELLARHIAHLFVRDPLVIYDEHIQLDDTLSSDHFENLQSTNWQSVRFKPPTPGSTIGWRVEFRTMEVQLTDFENAAFTVFIALVSRALLYFNLNFYIPLSKVDENMRRAHQRDGVLEQKFFWRKHIKLCPGPNGADLPAEEQDAYEEMSIRDIMLGSPDVLSSSPFAKSQPGLLNLVRTYLDMIECDAATRRIVDAYLDLISARCTGELMTNAAWLRAFVQVHPAYKHNSLLNNDIVYDLVETCNQVVLGTLEVPQLLGKHNNLPKHDTSSEPGSELKGAPRAASASAESSAVAAAQSAPATAGVKKLGASAHSFDLNEDRCCEKLQRFLAPYLEQASALPLTPLKKTLGAHSQSTGAIQAMSRTDTNAAPWVSPPPV